MFNQSFEAIVVGSGATGGVAAYTLASKGISVLVIEAGPDFSPSQAFGSEPINTLRRLHGITSGQHQKQVEHPGYWKANPLLYSNEKLYPYSFPKEKPFVWTRGMQVGGRSLTWGGITLRLSDYEFKAKDADGYGFSWPISYEELAPHYSFLERFLRVHGNKDGLRQLPDGEFIKPFPLTKSEQLFSKLVQREFNYPVIHSRGFGPREPLVVDTWPKYSSNGSTLEKALATGNVKILSNQMVDHIILDKERSKATGLIIVNQNDGTRQILNSKLIVLCASTIQTLRILLCSEEKFKSNGFIDPSGNLGCYLMDHISSCRFFSFPKGKPKSQSNSEEILSGAGSFFVPFGTLMETQRKADFIRGYGLWGGINRFDPPNILKRFPDETIGFLIGHGEVLAKRENKVTISKKVDQWGIPTPHIECEWGVNEKKMASHMQATIEDLIKSAGGQVFPLQELVHLPVIKPFIKNAMALQSNAPPPGYYIHEVGGAGMGFKKSKSVVDQWNRLWQCQNVLVVDGACWPTSGWQSPTLTMMAITRRACLEAIKHQTS